ncbi:MAG: nucleotidyl transferase AbiEii/AbiGii toxin family protein [Chloroflexia bacterium]|nr:nucleotidyl transferase AbiEii/AbiGii toxin family protein [Chloroflexia bacterium]
MLVFKGGNALDFHRQPNRSTVDLDFSFDASADMLEPRPDTIERHLERGLTTVSRRTGIALSTQSVRQNPPGTGRHFATIHVRIGYALPDEHRLLQRMAGGESSPVMSRWISVSTNPFARPPR